MGIYTPMMITQRIAIPMTNVGDNIKQTLERVIANNIEGKCIVEMIACTYSCCKLF